MPPTGLHARARSFSLPSAPTMARKILVVDDDRDVRATLEFHLRVSGYEVATAESAEQALSRFAAVDPDVVITDVQMPGMSGIDLLRRLKEARASVDVLVITGYESLRSTVDALRAGAYDYLVKPLDADQLDAVLEQCFEDRAARARARTETRDDAASPDEFVIGRSPEMIDIYKTIARVSGTDAPVLIRGETGTGKELVARALHDYSSHSDAPFIAVNCTAIAESLLESELFGHAKGAFTGAISERQGRFEMAGSGTIFLDEIGDTTPAFQAKLLRVLQEREFYPVGGDRPVRTEARVIAATHQPVEDLVRQGKFREDLYFRLRVVEITLPPLRARRRDIPALAKHLLARASLKLRKDVRGIPDDVMQALMAHPWPGNVREMENAIVRAVLLARGSVLSVDSLSLSEDEEPGTAISDEPGVVEALESVERTHVARVLKHTGGNKSQAAKLLEISRPRLDRMIVKYDLEGVVADA